MVESLSYCPQFSIISSRLKNFFERQSRHIILAKMNVHSSVIDDFKKTHQDGFCDYPDPRERLKFWETYLRERSEIFDDSVPSAYLSEMDQGLYGGLFGGDVRFLCDTELGWISSMVAPLLHNWSDFDNLSFSLDHPWFHRYLQQLDIFVKGADKKFGVSHFILINGLNFLFELVGATNTYLALDEDPTIVHRALDLAHDVNKVIHKKFFEKLAGFYSGTFSNFFQWIPGRVVSESVDPFHMTSVEYFEKWGREPIERIFAEFDGGITHVHANGHHLLEAVSTVKGLKSIWLGDDKGFPPVFGRLDELKKKIGNMPVGCRVEYPEFFNKLIRHELVGGVFYNVLNVPDIDTANKCMDLVRQY